MHASNEPRLLSYVAARRSWWGDAVSGQTLDWTYVLDDDVCQIVFGVPVGGRYTNRGQTYDAYERDIVWRVISGVLVAENPATGEVHRVEAGESLVCGGDVWHDGHNAGTELLTVVEFTAPAKSRATAIETRAVPTARQTRVDGAAASAYVLGRHDVVWSHAGSCGHVLVGTVLATPSLTTGELDLRPGQQTGTLRHDGIATLLVVDGHVGVQWEELGEWSEAGPRDGAYVPAGTPYRVVNLAATPATILFQTVPTSA